MLSYQFWVLPWKKKWLRLCLIVNSTPMFSFCGITENWYHKYQFSRNNIIWDYEYAKHLGLAQFQVSNWGIGCQKHYSSKKSLDYANSRKSPKDAMSSKCGGSIGTFLEKQLNVKDQIWSVVKRKGIPNFVFVCLSYG